MGYKGQSTVAASGVQHNPPPSTERGKRRRERKNELKGAYQASDFKPINAMGTRRYK